MPIVTLSELELTITNGQEILSMGGPYIGDIWLNDQLIEKDCIVDNFIYHEQLKLLFFVKYHRINGYQYFTINFYLLKDNKNGQFAKDFDMVHLKQFLPGNKLEIFHAFNDGNEKNRLVFDMDEEEFIII